MAWAASAPETFNDGLQRGMPLSRARAQLVKEGWKPVRTDEKMNDGTPERTFGSARAFVEAGDEEIETCTGTGLNLCVLNYEKNGRCLQITTQGELIPGLGEPRLWRWTNKCPRPLP
jgi:hypothetical protein